MPIIASLGLLLGGAVAMPLAALGGVMVGLGYGPMTPASTHMLARVTTPTSRPFVFSLKQTSVPFGGALAGLLLPTLQGALGWRGAAIVVALLFVARHGCRLFVACRGKSPLRRSSWLAPSSSLVVASPLFVARRG